MDFSNLGATFSSESSKWLTNFGPQVLSSGLQSAGLIKVSKPPTSNLTAAQVMSGQKGSISSLPSPASNVPWGMIAGIGAALIALIFFIKRK